MQADLDPLRSIVNLTLLKGNALFELKLKLPPPFACVVSSCPSSMIRHTALVKTAVPVHYLR